MARNVDPVDAALESLRVRGPLPRDSFLQELEDRMLMEQRQPNGRKNRWGKILAIAAACVIFGGGGSYAAVTAWRHFSTDMIVDVDGTVYDAEGQAIGLSLDNEDGTTTTTIQMGDGHVTMQTDVSLKGKELEVLIEEVESE